MRLISLILFVLLLNQWATAQEKSVLLSEDMFTPNQRIFLAPVEGWKFMQGNSEDWAKPDLDINEWKDMNPTALHSSLADETGRVEGWFRLKFRVDNSLAQLPLGISRNIWAATDVYLDGKLIHSFGDTGHPYEAYNPVLKYPAPIDLEPDREYTLSLHFVDYETTFTQRELRLKTQNLQDFINITGPKYVKWVEKEINKSYWYGGICIGITSILFILFWLLVALNPTRRIFWLIAWLSTIVLLYAISFFSYYFFDNSYNVEKIRFLIMITLQAFTIICGLFILEWLLIKRISRLAIILVITVITTSTIAHLFSISWPFGLAFTGILIYLAYLLINYRNKIKGSLLAVVAAMVLPTVAMTMYIALHKYSLSLYNEYDKLIIATTILASPLMLMIFISMRMKEVLKNMESEAEKVLKITEEKREILTNQNKILEQKVNVKTAELKNNISELKATQKQLIQSEKMASLGELTAGIAHEIQNPLNFVNNFSEVSNELLEEVDEELTNGDIAEVRAILKDVKQNLDKINHHGRRADGIVKGMLQHSLSSQDEKELTDINKLCDEYLQLAYHGLRAKDKSFNAELKSDFDPSIDKINVIPQDIGRVLLNLITNAFFAVNKRKQTDEKNYKPTVSIQTRKAKDTVQISIKDNGTGIPHEIKDKIFQPFFTTKPTGQGTGLGLSISYDIVKAHNGEIKVSSKLGAGTTFTIKLSKYTNNE